ncbi:MAG: hypothetical protein KY466_04565 [Gemmatimonadetes bacterium]|nr:hypothetical protein [Gemmatimonadota bacterium]
MRFILACILVLAIPAGVSAQQADQGDPSDAAPVQLEQTVTSEDAAPGPVAPAASTDSERSVESADAPAENAAVLQDPGSRQWWWIVGAVVVGALIVALVL